MRSLTSTVLILGCAVLIAPAPVALAAAPAAAPASPPAVVSQAAVTATPYDLPLAPNGELRVLSFDTGFVSSVVVAKPWLFTVLVQGRDVILQAKASSGDAQMIVYVGGTSTMWHVRIAAHGPAPARLEITAGDPESRTPTSAGGAPSRPGPAAGAPAAPSATLQAFLDTLTPAQRTGYQAWQHDPTMDNLSRWLAALTPEQQLRFNDLVTTGAISLPPTPNQASAAALVDTTTVIHPTPAPAPTPGQGMPAVAPATPPATPAPAARPALTGLILPIALSAPPSGMSLEAIARRTGDSVTVQYTIENTSSVSVPGRTVIVTTTSGNSGGRDEPGRRRTASSRSSPPWRPDSASAARSPLPRPPCPFGSAGSTPGASEPCSRSTRR